MEKKDGAKYDPGWNDPPLFSYETQTAQLKASKPRTFLNKRVAFPIHGSSPPISSNCLPIDPTAPLPSYNISTLPPPPSVSTNSPKEAAQIKKDVEEHDVGFNSSEVLESVVTNFCVILNTKFDDEKDKVEIQRRLDIMKKMWIDNKLCRDIQQKLLDLTQALKNNETEKADDLQKCLMVDHAPSCSPWMSGVRQLIRQKEPIPSTIDEH